MKSAMDGNRRDGQAGAGRRRIRRVVSITRINLLLGAVVLVTHVLGSRMALAQNGRMPSAMFASVRAVANRAMSIVELTPPAYGDPFGVAANRPVSVAAVHAPSPSDGPAEDEDPAGEAVAAPEHDEAAFAVPVFHDAAVLETDMGIGVLLAMAEDEPPLEAGIVLASATVQPAVDQPATPVQDSFIQSVNVIDRTAQRITVAINQSASIDVTADIDTAEIANKDTAVVNVESPRRVVVTGLALGTTQLRLTAGQVQRVFDITVERDLTTLRELIAAIAPTSDVRLRSLNGTIILSGRVADSRTSDRIIELASLVQGTGEIRNQMDVAGVQQILLRVVVAEVNKDATRRLGVNWAIGASDLSRDFFFANNLNQINPTIFGSSGVANVLFGQQTYAAGPVANGLNTNVTFGFPRAEFQMFINALRENNLFRVLAEPNLVALSGQTATFLAGGEVPIPVTQGGAVAGAITIEFHEFGVRLAFTPTILGGQRMRLHVMTEVSDAIPGTQIVGGLPVFSFTTRRVESTVECGNGQTFAIAGLLRETVTASASKIPGLGDIPVLGSLFSSVDYRKNNTELVVLVTPQLVEPLDPHQVAPPPGSLMTSPNDYELFALQKLEGEPLPWPEYEGAPRDRLPVNTRPGGSNWPTTQLTLHGPWGLAAYEER